MSIVLPRESNVNVFRYGLVPVRFSPVSWYVLSYSQVSSHPPRAKLLAHAIRRHWSIENGQHWVLDMCFGEDQRRQQDHNSGANLTAVRRLVVSLLRQEKTNTRGAKNKRLNCALDPKCLLTVLKNARF
jgi:hypothetical protein